MLNYLWGFMILLGLSVGIISGQVEAVSNAAIDSAGEAVTLAITMLAGCTKKTETPVADPEQGQMEPEPEQKTVPV